ncbi:MAG: response regulator [Salibacteraceae bacterium]
MDKIKILWADDEIDLLKPHVMFLEEKGYQVTTANNGDDALDHIQRENYDIVFLDENMPGLTGLETLARVKVSHPSLPVIMITKSEEESIMEDAIGSKISDYLIKPVNPKQILLSIKKNLDTKRLVGEKTNSNYQQEFRQIGMTLGDRLDMEEWVDIYKKLIYWELELEESGDEGMFDILKMQKSEANSQFCRFVEDNYLNWLNGVGDDIPLMSHTLFRKKVAPEIGGDGPLFMVLIDNLRLDQWKVLEPVIEEFFRVEEEEAFYSILPTATQYARNSIFAGLLPSEIEKRYPKLWKNDEDEGGKNLHEEAFLEGQLRLLGKSGIKFSYNKITTHQNGRKLADNMRNLMTNDLNVIVYNFVDMLSHARTEMEVIRELADDESAYRSLTLSWFKNSPLFDIMREIAQMKGRVVLTTDHGTVRVKEPSKVIGDRNTNTNLRYKQGRNLQYNNREVFEVGRPSDAFLPRTNVSTKFIFAKEDSFFAYPNNYNHYVNYYRDTFQHGGISLEEMIIPVVKLSSR